MLKAAVTQQEFAALTDAQKPLYTEADGAYVLAVEPVSLKVGEASKTFALEDVAGLKGALSKERTNVEALNGKLKRFEGLTEDPQAYKDALAKVKEWGDANPDEKVKKQIEATTQQLESRYRGEIEKRDKQLKDREQEVSHLTEDTHQLVIDNAASAALTQAGVLPESHDLFVREIRSQCRVRVQDVNGERKRIVEILDPNGNVRITNKSSSHDPMGVEELAAEMKVGRYAFGFKASGAAGSGAGSSNNQRGSYKGDLSKMSGPQLMAAGRK